MNTPTPQSLLRHRSGFHNQGGYTLVEIMLVLSIIAVLLGAGIHYMGGSLDTAKTVRVRGDLETLTVALQAYEMENMAKPTTEQGLQALVTQPTTEPIPRRWHQFMKKEALMDPWQHPYQYENPGKHNPNGFDLYSLGPNPADSNSIMGNWDDDSKPTN